MRGLSLYMKGGLHVSYVSRAIFYGGETWAAKDDDDKRVLCVQNRM